MSESQPPILDGGEITNELSFPDFENIEPIIEDPLKLIKDEENGSKLLQRIYEKCPEYRNKLFDKITLEILKLTKNKFFNRLIQVILDENDPIKNEVIYKFLIDELKELAYNDYATCVVQKLIENVDEKHLEEIADKLEANSNFEKFIVDKKVKNINHIFQSLIKRQKKEKNDKICEEIKQNFILFAKNKYGCYIIQALLEKCSEKSYIMFLEKTLENIRRISRG